MGRKLCKKNLSDVFVVECFKHSEQCTPKNFCYNDFLFVSVEDLLLSISHSAQNQIERQSFQVNIQDGTHTQTHK